MTQWPARLILQDKSVFHGFIDDPLPNACRGEVVFSTGMTGYPESLTDPSYAGQLLTFTFPLIGNYGVPPKELWESKRIYASGVIVCEVSSQGSHSQCHQNFTAWLRSQNIPLIYGVDTRALTRQVRAHGSMPAAIVDESSPISDLELSSSQSPVSIVSIKKPEIHGSGPRTVIAVDCGMKENIMRCLMDLPITVKRVPYDYDYSGEAWDGVFLSNGPGNPEDCHITTKILQKAMQTERPIHGICLGAQLMALAAGAKTYKLPFGHRGHNQPCIELTSRRCYITSQNHGYAIAEDSLPSDWEVSFRNLNDGSVEGIRHRHLPFSAVQFHPEAAPGPTDTQFLFQDFYRALEGTNSQ